MAAVYQVEHLTKIYRGSNKKANDEISLSIQEGEIFGLQDAINHVMTHIGLDQLDDFRILTPSLEDVYLQLGGGTALG